MKSPEVNSPAVRASFRRRRKKPALLIGPWIHGLALMAALLLATILAACGGDAVPGEDADTEAPAPEATDRVRAPAPGSPASDREILVTLYNALDGPNWEDSGNWLSDAPLGEWSGVTTDDNGRVIWLQMGGSGSGQELSGEIPLGLIDLGALEILGLDDYSGGLRGEIPPEFGNFPNLQYLSLSGGGLTGEIPPELGNLSNLRDLSIDGDGLTGEIPPELGNLASLQHLRLRGEGVSGGIPPELGNLWQLYELRIYGTQLGGAIPPELGNISLTELDLTNNEFSGEIPPWLGNHSDLIDLSLSGNQLSGEIPAEWGNFYRLEWLNLSGNQLSGAIPSGLGNIDTLIHLGLNDNQLNGAIPSELGNLDNLQSLTLHENQLSGEIPSEVWDMLEREVEIEIHGNDFPCLEEGGLRHLYVDQRANC